MSRRDLSRIFLIAVAIHALAAQGNGQRAQPSDAPAKWETRCSPRGCLLQTEVLRGESGDSPDPSDFHEYVGIDVALDGTTHKPAYFAFHVNPDAHHDEGISVAFTGASRSVDSDGTTRLGISDCDDKSCVARVPLGVVKSGRKLNLLEKFLKAGSLIVSYVKEGKPYLTTVPLLSFQTEYQRVMTVAFGLKK